MRAHTPFLSLKRSCIWGFLALLAVCIVFSILQSQELRLHAAGVNSLLVEAESGSISGPATVIADTTASGGQYVQLNSMGLPTPTSGTGSTTAFSNLHISGNKIMNDQNQQVILRGVNRSGSEYACIQGWGIFDGPNTINDDSQVPLMKSWGVNEVNLGINEDCWLNINGVTAAYGGANYISAIIHEVATLEASGIYPVISMYWEAPGTTKATSQGAMPDSDHAPAVWQSIANTFKNDHHVILRLKEEPYPAGDTWGASAWDCWSHGDRQYDTSNSLTPISSVSHCSEGYPVVGMQSLINIIRGTGATNIIQVPGVAYANVLDNFLNPTYKVSDSLSNPQLMVAVDVYPETNVCGSTTCYNSQYLPVLQQMPLIAGEIGEDANGSSTNTAQVDTLMNWLDQNSSGYSAWAWDTWGGTLQLITSYSTGAPNGNWGNDYKNHLHALGLAMGTTQTKVAQGNPGMFHLFTDAIGLLKEIGTTIANTFTADSKPQIIYAQTSTGMNVSVGFDVACDRATTTPWSDITQDNLFTLQTTAGSALDTSGQCMSSINVPQWVANVHANHRLALITIGGIADQNWQTACNDTYRGAFVTNLINYMKSKGFDGIDLDIEDDAWAAINAPVAPWDTCVQTIANAAHATTTAAGARPIISEDVTTPWMGAYVKNDVPYVDQFNLMTYGDSCGNNCSSFASDIQATYNQGIPKTKMVLGIDLIDKTPQQSNPLDCGNIANYSLQQGLMGTMVWDIHQDAVLHNGSFPCFDQIGQYIGASIPSPTSEPTATPVPPTASPTPLPCSVTPSTGTGIATISNATLPSTGTYNIFSRVMVPASGNGYYLQVDNGCPILVTDTNVNTWDWIPSGSITATAGSTHTITLYGKDVNVDVDAILFSQSCTPTGTGDNCLTSPTPTVTQTPTSGITNTPIPTSNPTNSPTPKPTAPPTPIQTPGTGSLTFINSADANGNFGGGVSITIPAGVQPGDLLIAAAGTNGTPAAWTTPTGWNKGAGSGTTQTQGLNWFWKIANGSESGIKVKLKASVYSDGGGIIAVYRGESSASAIAGVSSLATNAYWDSSKGISAKANGVSLAGTTSVVPLILTSWQSGNATISWPSGFVDNTGATDGYGHVEIGESLSSVSTSNLSSQTLNFSAAQAVTQTLQIAVRVGQ